MQDSLVTALDKAQAQPIHEERLPHLVLQGQPFSRYAFVS